MPPKRRHTKSRNGCMTCRRRRVKCDEIRPICANCTRRELDCVYTACCPPSRPGGPCAPSSPSSSSSSASASTSSDSSSIPSSSSSSPPSQQIVSPRLRVLPLQQSHAPASTKPRRGGGTSSSAATPLTALARQLDSMLLGTRSMFPSPLLRVSLSKGDLDNMSLLHHFTIRTYGSLTNDGSMEVYRTEVPRIALQNELTMHSLLAVTALHRSITAEASPAASNYRIMAAGHYDLALRALRTAIRERPQSGDALLVASTMIAFYGFACKMTGSEASHVPRVIGWIPLLQGVHSIIIEWWSLIQHGDLRPLLDQAIKKKVDDGDFLILPASLFSLVRETPPPSNTSHDSDDDDILDAVRIMEYERALEHLRIVWNCFWSTGFKLATALQWISHAPLGYVRDLQCYKPRALVIFCYFLCMIKKLDGFWWMKGSAEETFVDIERKLSTRWKPWLKWPKDIIVGVGVCEVVGKESLT